MATTDMASQHWKEDKDRTTTRMDEKKAVSIEEN
jgi:hypothetical protein